MVLQIASWHRLAMSGDQGEKAQHYEGEGGQRLATAASHFLGMADQKASTKHFKISGSEAAVSAKMLTK